MDYYTILDIKRDANDAQLKQAYHEFALKWHPAKFSGKEKEIAQVNFRNVAQAFEVLTDAEKRAIFDQYGEKGLKEGVSNGKGGKTGGYVFRSNPEEMFLSHFGSSSPFADFFNQSASGGSNNPLFQSLNPYPQPPQLPPQEVNLYCSLEELYLGCTKTVKTTRKRVNVDGTTTSLEERLMGVEINPGWRANTKITFTKEGDQAPNSTPGDLVFTVKEKPHPRFSRDGNDLVHCVTLSLANALCGTAIDIQTLDGRVLPIAIEDIAQPGGKKVVSGEGMPLAKDPIKKGNLVITFNIIFPQTLTMQQKDAIRKILPL